VQQIITLKTRQYVTISRNRFVVLWKTEDEASVLRNVTRCILVLLCQPLRGICSFCYQGSLSTLITEKGGHSDASLQSHKTVRCHILESLWPSWLWETHEDGKHLKKKIIYCVLYCLSCVFVLFRLCIFMLISFVCTGVRSAATEWQLNCSK
jgi:hypothetical protein